LIRRTTLWALRALLYLAGQPAGYLAPAPEVARAVGAPIGTTTKVLQRLSLAGMVVSMRGVRGGYFLAEPPAGIGLLRVLQAMEDPLAVEVADARPPAFACLDELLVDVRARALGRLEATTIADLVLAATDGRAT
jgi:Rrf2 family protein